MGTSASLPAWAAAGAGLRADSPATPREPGLGQARPREPHGRAPEVERSGAGVGAPAPRGRALPGCGVAFLSSSAGLCWAQVPG